MEEAIKMRQKVFDVGDILTAATGILVAERHMAAVYDILNWMTQGSLFTHQLPRAAAWAEPILRAQFPWIANANMTGITPENHAARLAEFREQFGATHVVTMLESDVYGHQGPLESLAEVVGSQPEGR